MLAPCSRGLGRRRVAWTAMAEPRHLGRLTGAASGRRRFQHVAEAGYTRLTMEGITARRHSEQRRAARESLTCQHLAQQRPGDSSRRDEGAPNA